MIYLLSCHTYLLTLWEPRAYLVKYKERGPRNTSLCNILYVRITSTKMQQKCIRRNRFFTVKNFFETKCSKQKIILLAKIYCTRFMITSFYSMRFWRKCYGATVILKDYWDRKFFPNLGPLLVNSIHISVLHFEKNKIF